MQSFLYNIWTFIYDIYVNLRNTIPNTANLRNNYDLFLQKQIFDGELISIGITWNELFLYFSFWFVVILFIVIFIKMILKIMGLIIEIWQ